MIKLTRFYNSADDFDIVEYIDGKHLGWQLENTILSASVSWHQVRVKSGSIRRLWRLTYLDTSGTTLGVEDYWDECPRIDIPASVLT